MNGNYEIMNIEGDFCYVIFVGLDEFCSWVYWFNLGNVLKEKCVGIGKQVDIFCGIVDFYFDGL